MIIINIKNSEQFRKSFLFVFFSFLPEKSNVLTKCHFLNNFLKIGDEETKRIFGQNWASIMTLLPNDYLSRKIPMFFINIVIHNFDQAILINLVMDLRIDQAPIIPNFGKLWIHNYWSHNRAWSNAMGFNLFGFTAPLTKNIKNWAASLLGWKW